MDEHNDEVKVMEYTNCIDNPKFTQSSLEIVGNDRYILEEMVLKTLRQATSYMGDINGDKLPTMIPIPEKRKRTCEDDDTPPGKRAQQ